MILSNSAEARHCYYAWQLAFKQKVEELKLLHWRRFLARTGDASAFQAYRFTKAKQSTTVEPLYRPDKSLCTDVAEQAGLLFRGTSIIHSVCDLSDIPARELDTPHRSFPPITLAEVNRAIDSLPKKKAVGPDNIPNELIQIGKSLISPFLTTIFNACIRQGFFPKGWRTATTAIIRKAGKPDYSDPNAYRPIALLCTMGKLFEKILNERLIHWIESNNVLPQGHMGGRRGRNLTDALIVFTSWVKHQWRTGKIVAGIFLDVKSAYPSVYVTRLVDQLHRLSCPTYLIPIISSFLTERSTSIRMGDYVSSPFPVKEGLPQGSPLSVTLYILYNSGLLLNNKCSLEENRISLGYVDDIVHLVAADSLELAVNMLQEDASRSLEWGRKFGAIFDPKKAVLMIFSHKSLNPPSFEFDGHTHTFQKSTRWLGIILDQRLTFSEHLKKVKATGDLTILQLGRIVKSTYGLNTGLARRLVVSVLYSRIMFGSIIWYNKRNAKAAAQVLDGLYHQACRLITGLFRQTPLPFVKISSGLKTPLEVHLRNSHFYILRALTYPTHHPVLHILHKELTDKPPTFPSPVHLILTPDDSYRFPVHQTETIHPMPAPPWIEPIAEIQNLNDKKSEVIQRLPQQIQQEIRNHSLLIFTDGSWIPEKGAGAAAVTHPSGMSLAAHINPAEFLSNFETELIGIRLAITIAQETIAADHSQDIRAVAIFCDNQGALMLSANPLSLSPGQHLYTDNYFCLKLLGCPIKLYWCPGHENIEANERADTLAKEAAIGDPTQNNTSYLPFSVANSLAKLKQHSRDRLKSSIVWSTDDSRRFPFSMNCTKLIQSLDQQEKGLAATIFQLRADHAPLYNFLFKIKTLLDPRCTDCFAQENVAHFLMFCNRYKKARADLKKNLRRLKCGINPDSFRSIMDNPKAIPAIARYILATNRFPNIRRYISSADIT
jgi:ribonuclease HI